MTTTLPQPDRHDTLVLPEVDVPPYVEHDDAPDDVRRQPPRRSPTILIVLVAAMGVLVALVAFLLIPWDLSPDPAVPPEPIPPAATVAPAATPTPAPTPTAPAAPAPVVVHATEARANWDITGVASGGRLDVFTGPGTHNAILTTLPADLTELESTGRIALVDGVLWRELVVPGDGTGWVTARHLTVTPEPPAPDRVTYGTDAPGFFDVTGVSPTDTLNIRTGPGTAHPVIATLAHDATRIESTGRTARVNDAPWREITLPGGGTGWVSAAYLTSSPAMPQVVYGEEPRGNWDVTSVPVGDVLNVFRAPGMSNPVVAALAPDTGELESTGRIAHVDGVLWRELVIPGDGTGWVDATYLTESPPPPTGPAV